PNVAPLLFELVPPFATPESAPLRMKFDVLAALVSFSDPIVTLCPHKNRMAWFWVLASTTVLNVTGFAAERAALLVRFRSAFASSTLPVKPLLFALSTKWKSRLLLTLIPRI